MRETSPRTRRPNASPRARARACPAASSTVTNISETVTATADRERSSGVPRRSTTVCLTRTGCAIDARIGSRESRLSAARPGEARDLLERRALRRVLRQLVERRRRGSAAVAAGRGRRRRRRAAATSSPPRTTGRGSSAASREQLVRQRLVGVRQPRLDRRLDVAALDRVLGVVDDLDRRAARRRRARACPAAARCVRRDDQRGERLADCGPSRSPPRGC